MLKSIFVAAWIAVAIVAPSHAQQFRASGVVACDDRYPHTCDVRGFVAPEKQKSVRQPRGKRATQQRRLEMKPAPWGDDRLVTEARRWIGTNPTNRSSLWCAAFMNFVLQRVGHGGTGSNFAKSFASFGQRVSGPQVGAIAVMARKGGGHVGVVSGVVSGVDARGNPVIISGNSRGGRVAETVYPRGRVYAYVRP